MSVGSSSSFEDSKFQDVRGIGWWFWISIAFFCVSISEVSGLMILFSGVKFQTLSSMSESSLSLSSASFLISSWDNFSSSEIFSLEMFSMFSPVIELFVSAMFQEKDSSDFFCDDWISGLFSSAQVCQTSFEMVGSGWDSISSAKIASGWKKSEVISRNARIFFSVQS